MFALRNGLLAARLSLSVFMAFLFILSPLSLQGAAAAPTNPSPPVPGTALSVSGGKAMVPLTIVPVTTFNTSTIEVELHLSGVSDPDLILVEAVYGPPGGGGTPGGGAVSGPATGTTGTDTGWQKYDSTTNTAIVYVDPEKSFKLYASAPTDGVVLVKPPAVLTGGVVPANVTASLPLDVVNQGAASTVPSVLSMGSIEVKLPPETVRTLADGVKKMAGTFGSLHVKVHTLSDQSTKTVLGALPPDTLKDKRAASKVITLSVAAVDGQGKEATLSMDKGSVSVPFDPELVKDPRRVNLYMIGSLVYVGGKVDLANNRVSADVTRLKDGQFIALEYNKTFKDIQDHWARGTIELTASKYVVQGMTDTEFRPQSSVTRSQFVTLLIRSLGIPEFKPAGATFKDVASGTWYFGYIEAAYKSEMVTGDSGRSGSFRPNDTITREEMAVLLTRAMKVYGMPVRDVTAADVKGLMDRFTDGSSLSEWARPEAAQAVNEGLIKGRDDGRFDPKGNGTRAEAAVTMSRLMKQVGIL